VFPESLLLSRVTYLSLILDPNHKNSIEYGGANPIFAGYIADTILTHNTFTDSAYSSICAGWGWGMASYMRNVHIINNQVSGCS
jgi:hypothetical protein